jgi:hypothetical protein
VLVTTHFQEGGVDVDDEFVPKELWSRGINENNQVMIALSSKYSLPLCSLDDYPDLAAGLFSSPVHLNARGNAVLADCVAKAIQNIVEEGLLAQR